MEYILSFALLLLNLINYEHSMNRIVFFALGLFICAALFYCCYKKSESFLVALLMMFCHTWQISWINIFGDPVSSLQLPWFYIIGALCAVYALFHVRSAATSSHNGVILAVFSVFAVISVYPLLTSVSKTEGAKEFIMIGFFVVLLFVAFLFADSVPGNKRKFLGSSFVFCVVLSSALIIFQTMYYRLTGVTLFKFTIGQYYGGVMTVANLLMEDTSCSTIMLGCGIFYMLGRMTRKNWFFYFLLVGVVAAALSFTTRRTSIVSLVLVMCLYVVFHMRGAMKKTLFFILVASMAGLMVLYLTVSRPVDNLSQYLDPNGRFENYTMALDVFLHNLFGVGYDNAHLATLTGGIIPHNTLLRWLCMGGIWFALPLVVLIAYTVYTAGRKKMYPEYWMLLYSVVASNFIPDLFNARFFVIPCMAALLFSGEETEKCDFVTEIGNKMSII